MPAYAPLSPLTNDPLAIVLLATPGAHGADEWDQCEAFWNSQLAALPEGSCLIPARGDAAGEGVLLAQALAKVTQSRVFVVPATVAYLQQNLIRQLAARLDQAHVVSLVRLENTPGLLSRVLRGSLGFMTRVLLALDLGPTPGWPGWRRWSERTIGWWCLGLRGADPLAPCKMIRSSLVPALSLQCLGSLVHGELVAKANFMAALLDEERMISNGKSAVEPVDPLWWRDFFNLFNRPVFGENQRENSASDS